MDESFELLENHLKSKNDQVGLIKLEWLKRSVVEALSKIQEKVDILENHLK